MITNPFSKVHKLTLSQGFARLEASIRGNVYLSHSAFSWKACVITATKPSYNGVSVWSLDIAPTFD